MVKFDPIEPALQQLLDHDSLPTEWRGCLANDQYPVLPFQAWAKVPEARWERDGILHEHERSAVNVPHPVITVQMIYRALFQLHRWEF